MEIVKSQSSALKGRIKNCGKDTSAKKEKKKCGAVKTKSKTQGMMIISDTPWWTGQAKV